eukprot:1517827-Pleurochrysis_carterae.AAC.1
MLTMAAFSLHRTCSWHGQRSTETERPTYHEKERCGTSTSAVCLRDSATPPCVHSRACIDISSLAPCASVPRQTLASPSARSSTSGKSVASGILATPLRHAATGATTSTAAPSSLGDARTRTCGNAMLTNINPGSSTMSMRTLCVIVGPPPPLTGAASAASLLVLSAAENESKQWGSPPLLVSSCSSRISSQVKATVLRLPIRRPTRPPAAHRCSACAPCEGVPAPSPIAAAWCRARVPATAPASVAIVASALRRMSSTDTGTSPPTRTLSAPPAPCSSSRASCRPLCVTSPATSAFSSPGTSACCSIEALSSACRQREHAPMRQGEANAIDLDERLPPLVGDAEMRRGVADQQLALRAARVLGREARYRGGNVELEAAAAVEQQCRTDAALREHQTTARLATFTRRHRHLHRNRGERRLHRRRSLAVSSAARARGRRRGRSHTQFQAE